MCSFLSAAETAARQRQNVRSDFKKIKKNTRAIRLVLEGHILFISGQKYDFKLNSPKRSVRSRNYWRISIARCCIDFFKTSAREKTNRWEPF